MQACFKVATKKLFEENPEAMRILLEYNNVIIDETVEMLKKSNIENRQEFNGIVVKCANREEGEKLRNLISEFIKETNFVYKKHLKNFHLSNFRWSAYCSNFFSDDSNVRPSYATLRSSAGPSSNQISKKDDAIIQIKRKEHSNGDIKLKIRYNKNEYARNFLEAMGETALGVVEFQTRDTGDRYEHRIIFINNVALLSFRGKIRNINYENKHFKYEDFKFTTPSDEDIKIIFKKIKTTAVALDGRKA